MMKSSLNNEKINKIMRTNNSVPESKKNLKTEIICGVVLAIILVIAYCFFQSWELLVMLFLVPPAMIGYCVYAHFKEKRHDKSSEKDMQEFLSGARHRQKEWKAAYCEYREKHTFEKLSKKGMKHDLIRRFRTRDNRGLAEIGLILLLVSAAAIFYPIEGYYLGYSLLGILFGGFIMYRGIYDCIGMPVIKFYKTRNDLDKIEKSYNSGKMLSFKDNGISGNGINIGNDYTVIYNSNKVFAIENSAIVDMTRKMVRVKKFENDVYSGQEYKYYVSVIYRDLDGMESHIDVRLDEFQCEMMIAEFHRSYYAYRMNDNIVSETNYSTVVTP